MDRKLTENDRGAFIKIEERPLAFYYKSGDN
jgi:hypothetical protein